MLLFLLCERELNFHLIEVIDLLASFIYRQKQFLTTFTLVLRMKTEKACFHLLKTEEMTNIRNDRNETIGIDFPNAWKTNWFFRVLRFDKQEQWVNIIKIFT